MLDRRRMVEGVTAGLLALTAGCEAQPAGDGAPASSITTPLCEELLAEATPADLRRGAEIWELLCTGCHGERGQGGASAGVHTADLTDPRRWARVADADRLHAITDGVEGTAMLGWRPVLVESEITAVYRHLCTLVGDESSRP